jgi:hypothetical protein
LPHRQREAGRGSSYRQSRRTVRYGTHHVGVTGQPDVPPPIKRDHHVYKNRSRHCRRIGDRRHGPCWCAAGGSSSRHKLASRAKGEVRSRQRRRYVRPTMCVQRPSLCSIPRSATQSARSSSVTTIAEVSSSTITLRAVQIRRSRSAGPGQFLAGQYWRLRRLVRSWRFWGRGHL